MNCPYCGGSKLRNKGYSGKEKKINYKCYGCGKMFVERRETKVILEKEEKIVTWRDLTSLAKKHQEIKKQLDFSCYEACAEVKPDKDGIVIWPIGDLHIGGEGVDYSYLEFLTDYIKKNKIYVILAGDELDFLSNFKNASALFQQVLNPEEQQVFLESWLTEIEPWLLCAGWGNHHEKRLESLIGINFAGKLKSRFAIYFDGIGRLTLKVGGQQYKIVLNHKGTGKSKYNPNFGAYDLARNIVDGDIFITAHYHSPAFSNFKIREKHVIAIQTGTLNKYDKFSMRGYHFGIIDVTMPALFLSSKERRIIPFESIEDAVRFRG